MRANDITNIALMTRPMDGGGIRVTAQLDGTDIAHAFFRQGSDHKWHMAMSWISPRYRSQGVLPQMQHAVAELGHQLADAQRTDEAGLGQLAKAAAVGAGVLGSAYLARGDAPPTVPMSPAAITQPADATASTTVRDEDPVSKAAKAALKAEPQSKAAPVDTETKVAQFLDNMVPLVKAENERISRERAALIRILSRADRGKLDSGEQQWLAQMQAKYNAPEPADLLKRVDVIPNSMAVAQAAVESGWGQDPLAQKANAMFGQRTWGKDTGVAGPEGERYAAFTTPADSIRAYMQNLNTHPAYEKFRDTRATLRAHGKPITGQALLPTITKYSRLGSDYITKVAKVMHGRGLHKLDR